MNRTGPYISMRCDGNRGLSLLPFLERNPGTFHLLFPLASQDPEVIAHSSFPFLLISDSDPTARIVAARVETDGGDRVASLFFLVQKDRYRLGIESLHPVTNVGVEKAWQRAGAAYRSVGDRSAPRFFEGQSGANGILSPFAPLFFCKEKGSYFHPPCPRCGRPLALCADDAILAAAGLPLYSGSLERHLFCEACAGSAGGIFYAVDVGSGAPSVLRDRISLVREFGRVGGGSSGETGFPCPACPEREECFGPSLKALARIVPFSFYPFHAFAFDAMSLCAPDFLALLSGAGAETLAKRLESAGERGRAALVRAAGDAAPHLFERGERRFLEVLYLKLSLLGELCDSLPSGERLAEPPEFRPSVDRAWVALGAARNLLPRYWNFHVTVLDIGRYGEEDASLPGAPGRDDLSFLSFLGVAWFEALLVNASQDGAAVRGALSGRLRNPPQGEASPFPGAREPGSPFFAGNLFFEPAAEPLSEGTAELWDGALAAGWSILLAGFGKKTGTGRETIAAEIRALRARVRDRLFEGAPPAALPESGVQAPNAEPAAPPRKPEALAAEDDADAAIAGILDAILRKWSSDAAASPPTETKVGQPRPRPAPPAADDFLVKTVMLGAQPGPALPPGAPLIAADTVSTPRDPPEEPSDATAPSAAPDDTIEKTIILRPGNVAPAPPPTAPPPPAPPPGADEFLDRTVILAPGKSGVVPRPPEKAKDAKEPESPSAPEPEAGIDLEKTVIIKPPSDTGKFRRHGR